MSGWAEFLFAQVGASAALAGFVFVGASINLEKIMSFPNLVLEAILALAQVLVASSLGLVPGQPAGVLGVEVLVVGLAAWAALSALRVNHLRRVERQYRGEAVVGAAVGQAATVPFVIMGAALMVVGDGGLYRVVPGVVFSYAVVFSNSWTLLIEINR